MKNKGLIRSTVLGLFSVLILVLGVFLFNRNITQNKTYGYSTGITNISQYVDELNANASSAAFVLQNLDEKDIDLIEGQKYKITCNDESLTLSVLDAKTNEELDFTGNIITMNNNGITVKVEGLAQGNIYDINIEPSSQKKGYKSSFNKATIKLDYTDVLTASVDSIIDNNNQSVELSNNEKIVFLYTDDDDKIKLRANEDIEIAYTYSLTELSEEELANAEFTTYDKGNYLEVTTNGYLYAKAKYKNDAYTKTSLLHITNIDKLAPVATDISMVESPDFTKANITYTISDQEATQEYGKSGLQKYVLSELSELPESTVWTESEGGTFTSEVTDNGTYYLHMMDNAGNVSVQEIEVNIITFYQPGYFVLILDSTNADLIGKVYHSLMDMKTDFDEHNLTNEDTVLAQIEGNIKNQRIDVENVNLALDLNGYILESRESDPTFNIKNGAALKVVDNKYNINDFLSSEQITETIAEFTTGEANGTIRNVNYDAINVNQGGTLQLGEDNSPDIMHVEYPNHETPVVQGKNKAIYNRGTFNYYDGVLTGKIALDGDVQSTPYLYDPNIVTDGSNHVMKLDRVTNVEALIGKTRYTLLEDAIYAANNIKGTSEDQIEIDVIVDLTKTHTIEIDNTKNIIIDLNGNKITNLVNEPTITNYGKTKIIDSTEAGEITNTHTYTIHNKENGEFTVQSGNLYNEVTNSAVIYNDTDAKFIQTGGYMVGKAINKTILNNGGIVQIEDGTLDGARSDRNNTSFLIYNQDAISTTNIDEEWNIFNNFEQTPNYAYGFDENEDGSLSPQSLEVLSKASDVYREIDLTEYDSLQSFNVEVDFEMNARDCDIFYAYISDTSAAKWYNAYGLVRNFYQGNQGTQKGVITLQGGKKYYYHLAFVNANDYSSYPLEGNKLNITNLTLKHMHYAIGRVTVNGGTFDPNPSYDSPGYLLYNTSRFNNTIINGGTFNSYNYAMNTLHADIIINGGTVNTTIQNAGDEGNQAYRINGGTITAISNEKGNLYIAGGTIGYINNTRPSYYNYNGYNQVYITGGTINDYIINSDYLDVKNLTMKGYITNNSDRELHIENTTFNANYGPVNGRDVHYLVMNNSTSGKIYIKDSTLQGTIKSTTDYNSIPQFYGIYNKSGGDLALDNVDIILEGKKGYTQTNLTDSKTNVFGVLTTSDSDFYMDNSSIIVSTDDPRLKSFGIYNNAKGGVYIGKKDAIYSEDKNLIQSDNHAIYNPQSNIYFYDGIIKGNNLVTDDVIYENETGYYIYRYNDENNVDIMKQVNNGLGNVLNVDTGETYNSLGDALDSVTGTANLKFLNKYNYSTENENNKIKESQNITLDLNGKYLYLGEGLINEGKFKIINTAEETPILTSHEIVNNGEMNIESGEWLIEVEGYQGILNNGKLTLKGPTIRTSEIRRGESIIYNNGELYIETGTTVTSGDYPSSHVLHNNYTGRMIINGGSIESKATPIGDESTCDAKLLLNEGGYVEINGGTLIGESGGGTIYTSNIIKNTTHVPDGTRSNTNIGTLYGEYNAAGDVPIDLRSYSGEVTFTFEYDSTASPAFYLNKNETTCTEADMLFRETKTQIRNKYSTTIQGGDIYYFHYRTPYGWYPTHILAITVTQGEEKEEFIKRGTMKITGGDIIDEGRLSTITNNNSDIIMTGGTIKNYDNGFRGNGIVNNRNSTFTMSNGTIINKLDGIQFNDLAYGTISGGTITQNLSGTANMAGLNITYGNVDISDITITQSAVNWGGWGYDVCGIRAAGNSRLNMTGGTITSSGGVDVYNGIGLRGTAEGNLKNVSVNIDTGSETYGVSLSTNGSTTKAYLDNMTVVVGKENSGNRSAGVLVNYNNEVYIKDSNIKAIGNASYGVYASGNSHPKVELSNNDTHEQGFVSKTTPVIQGTTAGVYRDSGTFNFYDGIIKGTTQIIGGITDKPEDYVLVYGVEGDLNTVVLDKLELVENVDTHVKYANIKKAVDACPDDEVCNLKELYHATLSEKVVIGAKKIINYNLNEFSISITEGKGFENNGNITFTNGTLLAEAIENRDAIIVNNNILTIDTGAVLDIGTSKESYAIKNLANGKLYIKGGTIKAESRVVEYTELKGRAIYNTGYVEITGGTISSSGLSAIYNEVELESPYERGTYTWGRGSLMSWGRTMTYQVDLSGFIGDVDLHIDYDCEQGTGYIIIDENEAWPSDTSVSARTFDITSQTYEGTATKTLVGGKKYYVHWYGGGYLFLTKLYATQGSNTKEFMYHGQIDIKGGLITSKNSGSIIINENADLNITGGEIKCTAGNTNGILNTNNAYLTMDQGTITDTSTSILFQGYAHGTINNSTINNPNGGGSMNVEYGYATIENTTFNISGAINTDQLSTLLIKDCTFNKTGTDANYNPFLVQHNANVTLKNIDITTPALTGTVIGLRVTYTYDGATVNFDNVNFDLTGRWVKAILVDDGRNHPTKINLKNSTIKAHIHNSYKDNGYAYGFYEELNYPTNLVMSNDDAEVSTTNPYLYGETMGVFREYFRSEDETLALYDGRIEGKTVSNAAVTKVPAGYNLQYGINGTDEYVIVGHVPVIKNVGTNIEYENFQSAVNNCPDNEVCNLKQINKFYMVEATTIPSNKNVIFDGDHNELIVVNNYNITNYGTFKYINGNLSLASAILNISAFENHGTLYIDQGTSMSISRHIDGRFVMNYKDGKVYFNCDTLDQVDVYRDITYNYPNSMGRIVYNLGGYTEFNGGTINSIYTPFYNKNDYSASDDGTILLYINQYNTAKYDTELDLTNVTGDVDIYAEFMLHYGHVYFTLDENPTITNYTENAFYNTNTSTLNGKTPVQTVQGGKKYYLHTFASYSTKVNLTNVMAEYDGGTVEPMKRAMFVMNGGTVNSKANTSILTNNNSTFIMNGGKITTNYDSSYNYGLRNNIGGKIIMNNGEIENFADNIYITGYSYVQINGGKLTGQYADWGIYVQYGQADINNVEITTNNGIYVDEDSKLFMNGGKITTNSSSTGSQGIYLYRSASATLKGNINIDNQTGYGIHDDSQGTLTIGENDGIVSQTLPHITGNNVALNIINGNAKVKVYDGLFTSTNQKIVGTVNEIPTGYQFNNAGYDCFLELISTIDNTYQYNHMNFLNINMAIEMIKSTDDKTGVIRINNDAQVQEQIVVPEGLDVTIALLGHQLTFKDDITTGIQNNGILRIIDGGFDEIDDQTESIIYNEHGTAINNNGTLIIGSDNNPNSSSPIIRGETAITGSSYQKKSGLIQNTEGGILQTVGSALARLFTFEIEPSYAYKTSTYQVNKLSGDTILATAPTYRAIESLDTWTNQNINVGMTSHNVGILSLVSDRDEEQTKEVHYTIEVYKNGMIDEFYTYKKTVSVQYLDENEIYVDLDWFDDCKNKFKNYYLTKMTVNDVDTTSIPEIVDDGTTIRLFYGQVKGEEITLVNPKTGRYSYNVSLIVALIVASLFIGFNLYKMYKRRKQISL